MTNSSEVPGFYKRTLEERRAFVRDWAGLTEAEVHAYDFPPGIDPAVLDHMIENVIGVMPLPLGIATNFRINGKDYLVPMAIEEPSVVAAASNSAKVARAGGGFSTQSSPPVMIGQVQILDVADPAAARLRILDRKTELLAAANAKDPVLVKFGGGAKDLEVRSDPIAAGTDAHRPSPGRRARRRRNERRQHDVRGARPGPRETRRRPGRAAHHLEPRHPPGRPGPRHLPGGAAPYGDCRRGPRSSRRSWTPTRSPRPTRSAARPTTRGS